ncbi:hypothetical protein [Stutzerimonas azotifigens]|uniref:hypothetical protein n=1 Tax=Stutzerimonas azotifigens TaxID=291995 RepID=UPI0004863777|nr:hypothetical protein [Stutzerimonas azotifigens]
MGAIDYLRERGFAARLSGKRVRVSPASRLTEDVRRYIKAHRLELLAELASGDGQERRCHWKVLLPGRPPFVMICEPITRHEALSDVQSRWPDATIKEEHQC